MDEGQFKEITSKLDLITRLLTLNLVKDRKTQKEKILALSSLGLSPSNIAVILGTSLNTANVALSRSRSKEKKQSVVTSVDRESKASEVQAEESN